LEDGEKISKIKWKGIVKETYEPEENLDGCLDLLQNYSLEHELDTSNKFGYYGYTGSLRPKWRNWVTLDQVIECYWIHERGIFKGNSSSNNHSNTM